MEYTHPVSTINKSPLQLPLKEIFRGMSISTQTETPKYHPLT